MECLEGNAPQGQRSESAPEGALPNGVVGSWLASAQALYGAGSLVNDPMEAAYVTVHLWAQALATWPSFGPSKRTLSSLFLNVAVWSSAHRLLG